MVDLAERVLEAVAYEGERREGQPAGPRVPADEQGQRQRDGGTEQEPQYPSGRQIAEEGSEPQCRRIERRGERGEPDVARIDHDQEIQRRQYAADREASFPDAVFLEHPPRHGPAAGTHSGTSNERDRVRWRIHRSACQYRHTSPR